MSLSLVRSSRTMPSSSNLTLRVIRSERAVSIGVPRSRSPHPSTTDMFSYQFYKLVHLIGLVILMAALGGIALAAPTHGDLSSVRARRLLSALHGLGIFLLLLGGFGLLARLGIVQGTSWPGWVWVKVVIWGILSVVVFLPYRFPGTARSLLFLLPLLGGLAAYMAIYKPL